MRNDKCAKARSVLALAVIGFSMAACSGGTATYTGTSNGETYTLKITADRYAAQGGDDYELTAGTKKSAGKVDSAAGGVLTLKPSNAAVTFTANVSGSSLTGLNGTVTWTDNVATAAPGALSGAQAGVSGVDNLTLSGQVYVMDFDIDSNMNVTTKFTPYTGRDKTLTSNAGGTGSVTNGQMSFSVGVPGGLEPYKLFKDETGTVKTDVYSNAKVNPGDTMGTSLGSIGLIKENISMSTNSLYVEFVAYTYVDKACAITAAGGTDTNDGVTTVYQNLNLRLNRGWNAVNVKITSTTSTKRNTMAISTGDLSSCKWVLLD